MEAIGDNPERLETRCCIAGGGPAGMMAGFLLARAGVDVVILEKHADFLRDFRGDTIHPSTLELMYELGLLEQFLKRPHQELAEIGAVIDGLPAIIADFSHLPTHCKFVGLMPQWDFLNFLVGHGSRYPEFHLRMQAEAVDLILEHDRVVGVRAKTPHGSLEVRAALIVGADGRHSTIRRRAGLEVRDLGAPIDVLWMRISREPSDPHQTLGRFHTGKILVTLDRGDYWQCAYVIPKGSSQEIQQKGIDAFREQIAGIAPFLAPRTHEIQDWNDVKLLTVAVDRLLQWSRPGLLCIGDSAHAMSPVGGVGINLAIQDAVAAANILAGPLSRGPVPEHLLRRVQRRREFPTRVTQAIQVFLHRHLLEPGLEYRKPLRRLPFVLRLMQGFPLLRRIPARMVGLGARPEHIRTSDAHPETTR